VVEAVQPVRLERGAVADPRLRPSWSPRSASSDVNTDRFLRDETRLQFSVIEGGDIVVRVLDTATGELIRQIPPAERLKIAARITSMLQRLQA